MTPRRSPALLPVEHIGRSIQILRGQRVLLDTELAALYGVTTKRFNEQVRRNRERFPADFMFQLSVEEAEAAGGTFPTPSPSTAQSWPPPSSTVPSLPR